MAFAHSNSTHGQLTINSQNLMTPATRVGNLQVLWTRRNRGSSILIPNVAGQKSRQRRRDQVLFAGLQMTVVGDVDLTGSPNSNPYAGLDTTMLALEAAIVVPPSGNTGYSATLTLRTGATKTASVFVENWQVVPEPNGAPMNLVTFDLAVPAGVWA